MELKEVITTVNNIKIQGIEKSIAGREDPLGLDPTAAEILTENTVVGSMFREDMEAMYIATFLIDYACFQVPENEIVFEMVRTIFGWSGAFTYDNLMKELTNNNLLDEKMERHLEVLKHNFLDKEMRKVVSEQLNHTILYLADENE